MTPSTVFNFQIMTDDDLKTTFRRDWGSNNAAVHLLDVRISDANNLMSCNETLKNYGNSTYYTGGGEYTSGFLDFSRYNNIYISSNIGGYQTLGPRRLQRTVIRKVPVTAASGSVINDRVSGKHDILECSKVTLSTLEFKFHDVHENVINLNGCHVSFSLVFTTVVEDR